MSGVDAWWPACDGMDVNGPDSPKLDGIDLTPLAPRDIERLTGVSGAIQRAWRSKGLLAPRQGSQARFDVFDAAAIAIRYRLSLQSRPPSETRDEGERFAPHLLYWVLLRVSGAIEVLAASEETLKHIQGRFLDDVDLVSRITRLVSRESADRFLIGTETKELVASSDLMTAFDRLRTPSGIFIDLESLASHFGLRSQGPLISLRYDGVSRGSIPPPRRLLLRP